MVLDNFHILLVDGHLSSVKVALTVTAALLLYCILLTTYRLYFHPLASIPGPKLAAITYWYEYYYDVTKQGSYLWKIIELHRQYGKHRELGESCLVF